MNATQSSYNAKFWKPKIKEDITFYKAHLYNYGFEKHVHGNHTISVIKNGVMDAFMQGQNVHLGNVHIVMLNPDVVHSNASEYKKDYKQYSLYLSSSFMKKLQDFGMPPGEIFFKEGALENKLLAIKLLHFFEQDEQNSLCPLDFECQFVSLVSELILKNSSVTSLEKLNNHDIVIRKAKEYINDNYQDNFSLEDLAKELDISKYHFVRLFKEKTFLSPMSYLMVRRIEKAKEKLQKGSTLIQAAHECGFYDQSHLNKRFKSVFGITPKEYKNLFL